VHFILLFYCNQLLMVKCCLLAKLFWQTTSEQKVEAQVSLADAAEQRHGFSD
jgi:hypothetical protein